jgi:hypothetical protein
MPTGEDIVQLWKLYVRSSYTTGRNGTLSHDTMARAIQVLIQGLMFRFPDFSPSEHYPFRIIGVFRQYTDEGMITRGLDRDRNPASAVVVRRVLKALYEKPEATTGKKYWDSRLNDTLMTVLVAALGASMDKYRKFLSAWLYTCSQLAT